jgi:hypothetical protein
MSSRTGKCRHLITVDNGDIKCSWEDLVDDPVCALRPKKMNNNIDPFYWVNHGGDPRVAFKDCVDCSLNQEDCFIHVNNLLEIENENLKQRVERALMVIEKLRLEIKIRKDERRHLFDFIQKAKNLPEFEGNLQKKAAVTILKVKLEKECFI